MKSDFNIEKISTNIITAFYEEKIFSDLKIIILWLFFSFVILFLPIINSSLLRVIFSLPIVLIIPGYSLIAALYPNKDDLDLIQRFALSFGLSLAIVPLIGFGLNYTPWGIRLVPIIISLSLFILVMTIISQYRRGILKETDRFIIPFKQIFISIREDFFPGDSPRIERILSYILLISIISVIGTMIFVMVFPKEGEKFTEFYILGKDKMTTDYPSTILSGELYPVYIGIGNHEYRNITYTVETYLMNMTFYEQHNTTVISRMDLIDQYKIDIPNNETNLRLNNLTVPNNIYNRVEFLLFNETVPGKNIVNMDRINASYRNLHLWVSVYSGDK